MSIQLSTCHVGKLSTEAHIKMYGELSSISCMSIQCSTPPKEQRSLDKAYVRMPIEDFDAYSVH